MANDVTLPGTGEVIATEEIASREYQLVKPKWGGTGAATDISAATPMPVATYQGGFAVLSTASIDANDDTEVTAALDVTTARRVGIQVVDESGAHTTHVIEIQGSVDATNYYAIGTEVTGEGIAQADCAVSSIRAKVKTEEGGASVVTVILFSK
jgi:t-SNARE complex subunit (syntaxin)